MNLNINVPGQTEYGPFSVKTLGLVDSATPAAFDSLTRLAMQMFSVPVALISIVQEDIDRQFFLSQQGLCDPWKSIRQTPLSHSFCQHVKREGKPLVVSDARNHPLVENNMAISELDVVAYLGVPIFMPDGSPLGALCVIDSAAREWTDEDLASLTDLANCVNDEILLRAALIVNERAHRNAQRYNAMRESIASAFIAPELSIYARFQELLRASCEAFGMMSGRITKIDCGLVEPMFEHDISGKLAILKCQMNLDSLTRLVASECKHVHFDDLSNLDPKMQFRAPEQGKGCYAGAPLVLDGTLYGIIEFFSDTPKTEPWNEEDLSIMSIVSMLATAHLGVFGKIEMLRNSETALLRYISEIRNPVSVGE